jgi:negative regulator of sigma-B (phosphoserine phosphatase)
VEPVSGVAAQADWPAALERGVAAATLKGEPRSGDLAVLLPRPHGALVAVIDGLGHGAAAAEAAEAAAATLRARPGGPPDALLRRCHEALRRTRGVVMTLAELELEAGGRARLAWTGVGNVEGRLLRAVPHATHPPGRAEGPVIRGGVVGYALPALRSSHAVLEPGDLLVFATDGLRSDFLDGLDGAPHVPSVQALADRLLAEHARGTDDALVVAVRLRAP